MMEDLSPAITAIKAMQFAAEDIFASFHMSREDVLAIIPQHDDESNTIEKFTKHYIPKEFHFRHHLEDVLPEEFSCDEETLCAETFYHALLDFLSILKAHMCIILQLEGEHNNAGDLHHQKMQRFYNDAIPGLENGLERFRNDRNLNKYTAPQHTVHELPDNHEVKKAYYIAIIWHLKADTNEMFNLYQKL